MGVRPFYGSGPRPLVLAGSRATRARITINGIPGVIFVVCTQFTNVAAGRLIQPGVPRVGHPRALGL